MLWISSICSFVRCVSWSASTPIFSSRRISFTCFHLFFSCCILLCPLPLMFSEGILILAWVFYFILSVVFFVAILKLYCDCWFSWLCILFPVFGCSVCWFELTICEVELFVWWYDWLLLRCSSFIVGHDSSPFLLVSMFPLLFYRLFSEHDSFTGEYSDISGELYILVLPLFCMCSVLSWV